MAWMCLILLTVNVAFRVLRLLHIDYRKRERKQNDTIKKEKTRNSVVPPPAHSLLLSRLHSDNVHFSGAALDEKKFWTLLTATIDHGDWSHLVNNMIMFGLSAGPLERIVGPWLLCASFFTTGALGWLFSLQHLYKKFPEQQFIAKFQSSVGSSPATYGLVGMLIVLNPNACCASLDGSFPSWLGIILLWSLPLCLQEKYGLQLWAKKESGSLNIRSVAFICSSGLVGYGLLRPFVTGLHSSGYLCHDGSAEVVSLSISASQFFTAYLFKCFVLGLVCQYVLRLDKSMSSTDDACHLGGVVTGIVLGLGFRWCTESTFIPFNSIAEAVLPMLCLAFLTIKCFF